MTDVVPIKSPTTWGKVLAGDEIRAKNGEFFRVLEHDNQFDRVTAHVDVAGIERAVRRKPSDPVTIRRVPSLEETAAFRALRDAFGSISLLGSSLNES